MRAGTEPRENHLDLAPQLIAARSRARQLRELVELVGSAALGESDRHYYNWSRCSSRSWSTNDRTRAVRSTRPWTAPGVWRRRCHGRN